MSIPIEVSGRHVHLAKRELEALFGKGYNLKKEKNLNQPGDFLAKEKIELVSGKRRLKAGIVGPLRKETQVELSQTDFVFLKLRYALKDSGDIEGTPGVLLSGPLGEIEIKKGVINTRRHIHCGKEEARKLGLKDGDMVSVKTKGKAAVTFHNVRVRTGKGFKLFLHLDTDEGNAACIPKKGEGIIL